MANKSWFDRQAVFSARELAPIGILDYRKDKYLNYLLLEIIKKNELIMKRVFTKDKYLSNHICSILEFYTTIDDLYTTIDFYDIIQKMKLVIKDPKIYREYNADVYSTFCDYSLKDEYEDMMILAEQILNHIVRSWYFEIMSHNYNAPFA